MKLIDSIKALENDVVEVRQALHKIPEEGLMEYKTSKAIEGYLKALECDELVQTASTGWIAYFKGQNPKKTYAFRTDIDGLSVEEATGLTFKSEHPGYMHACGHDGHMTIALTFAKWISEHKEQLHDNIVIIFQPAEEGPGGAEIIVTEKVLDKYNIDAIFGLHLFPEIAEGLFGIKEGPIMAMTGEFDIDVYGKSAHGAKPHLGIDSVLIAANLLQDLQQIVSRQIDPVEPVVITVGRIEGGERRNVIAGKTRLEGTIRGFNVEVFDRVEDEMKRICASYEGLYKCEIKYEIRRLYPPVINDPQLTNDFIENSGGEIMLVAPQMLAEDFSYFNKVAPCLFFFLGTRNEEKGFVNGLHHEAFNFSEPVLLNAIQAYVNLLEHYGSLNRQ